MFFKFIQTKQCMLLLSWILEHPEREYKASIVQLECGIPIVGEFMAALNVLQGVEIVRVSEIDDDLIIAFRPETSISQLLVHFKDEFNDLAFISPNVSPALSYFYSDEFRQQIDNDVLTENSLEISNSDMEAALEMCKNFEEMDITNEFEQQIYDMCKEMKENDIYDEFIEYVEGKVLENSDDSLDALHYAMDSLMKKDDEE